MTTWDEVRATVRERVFLDEHWMIHFLVESMIQNLFGRNHGCSHSSRRQSHSRATSRSCPSTLPSYFVAAYHAQTSLCNLKSVDSTSHWSACRTSSYHYGTRQSLGWSDWDLLVTVTDDVRPGAIAVESNLTFLPTSSSTKLKYWLRAGWSHWPCRLSGKSNAREQDEHGHHLTGTERV